MKSILIIGAGMGGLAAGIYGQMNGYQTQIEEMHVSPGGQCASWQRKGYTFDACIHHLMGCKEGSKLNKLWRELGGLPREMISQKESVAFTDLKGNLFYDYNDLGQLREHMLDIAPEDKNEIEKYIKGIRSFVGEDMMGSMMMGGKRGMIGLMPTMLRNLKYMNLTLGDYAKRFKNPLLRRAIALLEYSIPELPTGMHFAKHAAGAAGDILWPVGGSGQFAKSIAGKYQALGGKLNLGHKVTKILTESDKAIGVLLEDGSKHYADIIISNADGRKTIYDLLEGNYADNEIAGWAKAGAAETNWGTMVYLGVNRDLSHEPSALVMLLDEPVTLAGKTVDSLEMQIYGFDPSLAPNGKGVIKVEMITPFSYWECGTDKEYKDKKRLVADQAITILEKYFEGIANQVEVLDVVTIKTWERFMGGTRGFANAPNKPFNLGTMLKAAKNTLPGLDGFYLAGIWVTSTGALFANALSGKNVIKDICKRDGKRFAVR
ncbi:MAG: NAD(P)/FAD-dependent oxidoreductase [Clostridiales bacterium]|jgi:phytoene dehydrogenase-like protein|nr:NAD(P)/FAD-dependent oxidoreductase [Clostridiales bacterium]